jgi:predicted deacylase
MLTPGKLWRGRWEIGVAGVPALPVLAARGKQAGPALLVTGGVHGDEYEGPAAIQALFNELDAGQLRGTLVGLPVVNVAAWETRARVAPSDGLDLNRVFPDSPEKNENPTRRLAQVIFETFVRRCDVLVDLHSGGAQLVHLPLVGWYTGGSGEAERLARGFGATLHPWLVPDVPGVLSYEAHRANKISIGAEWGGGARLDPVGVVAYTAGLRQTLAALRMVPAERVLFDTRLPIRGDYQVTEIGGLFTPVVSLGEPIEVGAPLGLLRNLLGEVVAEVQAARTGIVAGLPHLAWLQPGDRVAYIG